MTDLEIAKTLKDAAQYIRDHGWCQGGFQDDSGRVCAMGGVIRGNPQAAEYAVIYPAHEALKVALGGSVMCWNDEEGRTVDEVLDLLESVALQHELRALAVTTLSQDAATAVCDNTVPEAVNA